LVFIGNNFFADSLVDSAASYYQQAVGKEPSNPYFLTRVAEIAIVKGDVATATTTLEQAAEAGLNGTPEQRRSAEQALARLCGLQLNAKEWGKLTATAKRIVDVNPKSVPGWLYLGVGYQGAGNTTEACRAYKETLKLDPNSKPAKENLKALGC
jgi:predicted Zn-dependent protease